MEVTAQLYDCTKRLYEHLQEGLPEKERDPYIRQIEDLLEQREWLVERLPQTFTNEESRMGKDILWYDHLIQDILVSMFERIRGDVGGIQRQKVTNARYAHPYQSVSADGMFLDKRK